MDLHVKYKDVRKRNMHDACMKSIGQTSPPGDVYVPSQESAPVAFHASTARASSPPHATYAPVAFHATKYKHRQQAPLSTSLSGHISTAYSRASQQDLVGDCGAVSWHDRSAKDV